jgi:competence protein ComEC
MAFALEAFAEDCTRAAVVVSVRDAVSPNCAAILIDRKVWRSGGAVALRWTDDRFEQTVALPPKYDRPWGRGSVSATTHTLPLPAAAEVTPRAENLEADD